MADLKITQLTELTKAHSSDNLAIVDNSSTPTTKKITKQNFAKGLAGVTLRVAASNALDTSGFDYVCTGTNDEVTINTALAALPSSGGSVYLSEGTFHIKATINVGSFTLLKGAGRGGATKIFKDTGGFPSITMQGSSSAPSNYSRNSTLEDLTFEGNAQTGGLLKCYFTQTNFFNRCEFNGCNDVTLDIEQMQDSYFLQCTANTNHSSTLPVIHIQGGPGGNSNMIWFEQCRIEDFWFAAVQIEHGAGTSNNNGFYFHQCKFESTQVGGNMFVADDHTLDLHLKDCFFSATGFKSGYSTPVDAINTNAHNLASYEGIYFNASSGIGNSAINVTSLNGRTTISNVLFDGTPVTSALIFGSSGAQFMISNIGLGSGTLITGDASGRTRQASNWQFDGQVGFYGTTPAAQQVLATGASHTVDDVITALQNLGLVKQS